MDFFIIHLLFLKIAIEAKNGGEDCKGVNIAKQICKVDCKWNEFSAWSECCPAGTMERTRTKLHGTPRFGGQDCTGDAKEIKQCPTHCRFAEWSEWSACSKTCGKGTQIRTRKIHTDAKNGGKECRKEELIHTKPCNEKGCCGPTKVVVDPTLPPEEQKGEEQKGCRNQDDSWH